MKIVRVMTNELCSSFNYDADTGFITNASNGKFSGDWLGDSKYPRAMYKGKRYLLHRLAWFLFYNEDPVTLIDHIDGNTRNNSISNLRKVDHIDNARNSKLAKDNKSGVIGVSFCNTRNKWIATIQILGSSKTLGRFNSLFDAVCVRKGAEIRYGFHENHGRKEK